MRKGFVNQMKITEDQTKIFKDKGKEQVKAINKSNEDVNKNNELYQDNIFNELFNERMGELYDLSKEIDSNNLTYLFQNQIISPI